MIDSIDYILIGGSDSFRIARTILTANEAGSTLGARQLQAFCDSQWKCKF